MEPSNTSPRPAAASSQHHLFAIIALMAFISIDKNEADLRLAVAAYLHWWLQ
jgi:hypothetical protein